MCLIIDRPSGVAIPAELIDNGLIQNGDGWGIMSSNGKTISIRRGLESNGFHKALKVYGDQSLVIHFRWTTHGGTNIENCHPYEILGGKYAVMHNGIISAVPDLDEKRSDTWHFCRYVLTPLLAHDPGAFGTDEFRDVVSALIGPGSKLVILRADGAKQTINAQAGMQWKGLWLSNSYSCPLPPMTWPGAGATAENPALRRFSWEDDGDNWRWAKRRGDKQPTWHRDKDADPYPEIRALPPSPALAAPTRAVRIADDAADARAELADEELTALLAEHEADRDQDMHGYKLSDMAGWSYGDILDVVQDYPQWTARQIKDFLG